ncbi:MAG: hypothetical protein GY832_40605 [Chloroflexi bacterium]|nr:hypothetical protein [Chloroflexota bacterium]
METLQFDNSSYIALVRRTDVETTPDDPVQLAIYAPGTVCFYWPDHQQQTASFNYGFLVYDTCRFWKRAWGLSGSRCLVVNVNRANVQPWKTALNQRQSLAGTGVDIGWRWETRKSYWRLVRLIGLMTPAKYPEFVAWVSRPGHQ